MTWKDEYKFKRCDKVKIDIILKIFLLGFSDYIIPIKMNENEFTSWMHNHKTNLKDSYVLFDKDTPIGLVLGGSGIFDNKKTLRCAALCVIPSYRNKGISKLLLEKHKKHGINSGVKQLFLEVITTNIKAVNLYKNFGYEINYKLEYFEKNVDKRLNSNNNESKFKEVNYDEIKEVIVSEKKHLSWTNSNIVIEGHNNIRFFVKEINGINVSSIVITNDGSIRYINTLSGYRKNGYATSLMNYVISYMKLNKVNVYFAKDEKLKVFFENNQFEKKELEQYEMYYFIDNKSMK